VPLLLHKDKDLGHTLNKNYLIVKLTFLTMKGNVERSLMLAIVLTLVFFVVEVIGGFMSGSLSLLGDAGHMFRDVFGLFISLSAIHVARRLPHKTRTFGYHRAEIFAAFFNGLLLIAVSAWIFWEAYHRFLEPQVIESKIMFIIAVIGLLVNVFVASRLHGSHDLNVKSAYLHVLTDTLSSVAVIGAAIWIYFTGQTIIDPGVSVAIALFILFSAIKVIIDSVYILLEFTPRHIDLDELIKEMKMHTGVEGVHSLHVWSLCSNIHVLDAHVYTTEKKMASVEVIKQKIKKNLQKYNIKHVTLEFECEECEVSRPIRHLEH
jgi:cobalt-zinc-cadmium efflux system protein